ncbi:MAG: 30S ribosomal protein S8e [Nanoarchaeota archaeon]|nr:30S ribosomal protein S8e [Nanoarchaeota archaeon]MBU4124112.1 30S ribosomal protein S8e [Nanoarchaeota archaeon]
MAIAQRRSARRPTSAVLNNYRKKKKRDFGNDFIPVKIAKVRKKAIRTMGGSKKMRLMDSDQINVTDTNTGKTKIVKAITVKENPANPNYVRMNIMTKGTVVDTELGLVKITSKPGQHGMLNGILIKK